MQEAAVGLLAEGILNLLYVNTNILNILLSYYPGYPSFLTCKANTFFTKNIFPYDEVGVILPWSLTRNMFHFRVIYLSLPVLFDVWQVTRKLVLYTLLLNG